MAEKNDRKIKYISQICKIYIKTYNVILRLAALGILIFPCIKRLKEFNAL